MKPTVTISLEEYNELKKMEKAAMSKRTYAHLDKWNVMGCEFKGLEIFNENGVASVLRAEINITRAELQSLRNENAVLKHQLTQPTKKKHWLWG